MLVHAFTTRRYLDAVTLPAIERGLARAGRPRDDFQLCYPAFVAPKIDFLNVNTVKERNRAEHLLDTRRHGGTAGPTTLPGTKRGMR